MTLTDRIRNHSAGVLALRLSGTFSPREALDRLAGLRGRVLLESADESGRYSMLSAEPLLTVTSGSSGTVVRDSTEKEVGRFGDPFAALEDLLARVRMPAPSTPFGFAGGVVGFLSYEAGDVLERLPPPPAGDGRLPTAWLGPTAWFGLYDCALVWDRSEGRGVAVASLLPGYDEGETRERMVAMVSRLERAPCDAEQERAGGDAPMPETWEGLGTSLGRSEFMEGVDRIRSHIRAGDLFQANLTRQIGAPTRMSGTELYGRLIAASPAPFAAYLDCASVEVASVSPELFLSSRGGQVRTRPIKGTARRGDTPEMDRQLAMELVASGKDRAENVMIVDLLRNDLSRVCRPGSVQVPELARLETHPSVHHLVSTVEGRLVDQFGPIDLLRATFPGGSITGAPKIRAMEILREIEPTRRGVYTGAIGILGFHGDLELSVAIRTAVVDGGYATYGTGGGITLASVAEEEWVESEVKAWPFRRALGL